MKHVWRTYRHSDWLVQEDCIHCGARRKCVPGEAWGKYDKACTPPTEDLSAAQAKLAAVGDEKR